MFVDLMESCCVPTLLGNGSPPVSVRFPGSAGPGDWRVDLCTGGLAAGQQISFCLIIDLDTRFCLAGTVVHRFDISEMISTLEDTLAHHQAPQSIFVGQHTPADLRRLEIWGAGWGVIIRPGTGGSDMPWSSMRMPTAERWSSLAQAKRTISPWRRGPDRNADTYH